MLQKIYIFRNLYNLTLNEKSIKKIQRKRLIEIGPKMCFFFFLMLKFSVYYSITTSTVKYLSKINFKSESFNVNTDWLIIKIKIFIQENHFPP